jgi:hypothetical protein
VTPGPASTVGFFFAPNFIQNLYTVLKKRLWESRSTPTLVFLVSGLLLLSADTKLAAAPARLGQKNIFTRVYVRTTWV